MLRRKRWIVSGSIQKMYVLVLWKNSKWGFPFFLQVTQYLLDKALIIDEDTLYELSLKIEPRLPAWRSSLALSRWNFRGKQKGQNCACHASHSAGRTGVMETKPVSFVPPRWWNQTGILSPAREAQLVGVEDRCFRLGWEGEEIDIWKSWGHICMREYKTGGAGSHFNEAGKKGNLKLCCIFY